MFTRLAPVVALASMAALMLAGCTPEEPVETTPAETSTAAVHDERRSFEAAREAWDAYQARIVELEADPARATLESLKDVAAEELARALVADLERSAALQVRTEGQRSTTAFTPSDLAGAPYEVMASACVDVSRVRVLGADGSDHTPAGFGPQLSYSVAFERTDGDEPFVVSSADRYEGTEEQDPCS